MKKAILISLLALMFCVFCVSACRNEEDQPPVESTQGEVTSTEEPTRTRVPVVTSTLPPLPVTTDAPETTRDLDDSIFLPETFEEQDGTLAVGSDVPGYGELGR